MGNTIANIIGTLGIVAIITTLVLPGRGTAADITASLSGLSDLTKASLGQ